MNLSGGSGRWREWLEQPVLYGSSPGILIPSWPGGPGVGWQEGRKPMA